MSKGKFCVNPDPTNIFTVRGFEKMLADIYADEYRMAVERHGRISASAAIVLREMTLKCVTVQILDHLLPAGSA